MCYLTVYYKLLLIVNVFFKLIVVSINIYHLKQLIKKLIIFSKNLIAFLIINYTCSSNCFAINIYYFKYSENIFY